MPTVMTEEEYAHRVAAGEPLFETGKIVATQGVMEVLGSGMQAKVLIMRHLSGDFGNLDKEDIEANNASIRSGEGMILSSYEGGEMPKVYVITEHDRSVTTVLLPEEY